MPETISLSLEQIFSLAYQAMRDHDADHDNSDALAHTVMTAERDGSLSHGLFRLPAYLKALSSGKANGKANPTITQPTSALVKCHGDNGFAPIVQRRAIPHLIAAAKDQGIAVLAMTHTHHMAALWPEVEALAEHNLAGFACVSYMPMVAPAGASKAFFGTNPIGFAWPRPGKDPMVFDMATAALAMGEVQVAAREGHSVPEGTGLDADGNPTTDPAQIANGGVLLPFGGYKGSAIAMMVELLAGGLIGESFSYEAKARDNGDGGPPQGGQFILALNPEKLAGPGWQDHCDAFFERLTNLDGTRLPGERRHRNRQDKGPRQINKTLIDTIAGEMKDPAAILG
ncbi:MAG: Ldh family oxidoreductase [Proteobacteria bacterium]|nr:Ldh family oxidoreductase [Pseudomonadota bacterium]